MNCAKHCLIVSLTLSMAAPSFGGPVTGSADEFIDIAEVFIDAQAANVTLLARLFGVAPGGSAVSFSSQFDDAYKAFSFSAVGGSSYRGDSLALMVTGILNDVTGLWVLSSAGQVGVHGFTGSGAALAAEHKGPAPRKGQNDWVIRPGNGTIRDYHSFTSLDQIGDVTTSKTTIFESINDVMVVRETMTDRGLTSKLKSNDWEFTWSIPKRTPIKPDGRDASGVIEQAWDFAKVEGVIDRSTGIGHFVSFANVPEPSTFWLTGLALVAMIGAKRRPLRGLGRAEHGPESG